MKAVQRAYGLFDPGNGMHLLRAGAYGGVVRTLVFANPNSPRYRPLQNKETNIVHDIDQGTNRSDQPGSAAALTAFMIALMQDKLIDRPVIIGGKEGCDTIRALLGSEAPPTATSLILQGVRSLGVAVTKAHTKLGILRQPDGIRCEFAYLEASGKKYAVIATGIVPTGGFSAPEQGFELGSFIHTALTAP
jgi:hypothetical protein